MGSYFDIGGTAGMVVLAAPLLLLATALMWLFIWPGLTPSTPRHSPYSPDIEPTERGPKEPPPQKLKQKTTKDQTNSIPGAQPSPQREATKPDTEIGPADWMSSDEPEADLDPRVVEARQHFKDAMTKREAGEDTAAADHLRNTIMLATSAADNMLHARARLELGDISQAEGDLITACEHWQLARSLFEDMSNAGDAEVCEKRMLGNGCPTDWVLTDF
ncbi:MAG: hypothetical protein RIC14_04695 [Filomicrobium sp.]